MTNVTKIPIRDRLSERLAAIVGTPAAEAVTTPTINIAPAKAPEKPRADLGPNQLAWLRAKVPSFEVCERLALEAEKHRKRILEGVKQNESSGV
jgi:hypothetical protein